MLELKAVRIEIAAETNIIVGQSHFIKTVEDLYEAFTSLFAVRCGTRSGCAKPGRTEHPNRTMLIWD